LKEGTQNASRVGSGASDQPVNLPVLEHHRAKVIRIGHNFARVHIGNSLVTAQVLKTLDEQGQIFGVLRVDDENFVEGYLGLLRGSLNLVFLSQKNRNSELKMYKFRCRRENAWFGSLRENNPFGVLAKFAEDTLDEFHG